MYAQRTKIRVPAAKMKELRDILNREFLPVVSRRPGFIAAYLLEQVDDEDAAEMIQFWENHAAAEAFTRTGSLASSIQALAIKLPGVQIQRQGYIVRVAVSAPERQPARAAY